MTVTKQQQLEWLAKVWENFTDGRHKVFMYVYRYGDFVGFHAVEKHAITREEWQQERDKMSSKPEVGSSWYERGEFPPAGCECDFRNSDDEWDDWCRSVFVGFDSMDNGVVSVLGDDEGTLWISNNPSDFRPLRTEREKAIDEMMSLVMDGLMSHEMAIEFVIKLHDAGYRKENP